MVAVRTRGSENGCTEPGGHSLPCATLNILCLSVAKDGAIQSERCGAVLRAIRNGLSYCDVGFIIPRMYAGVE
eukprot:5196446-Karenia_brevis.AAC.1